MSQHSRVTTLLALLFLLATAWLLWSGIYKPLLLVLGVFSCAISALIAHRVGLLDRPSGLHVLPKLPGFSLWMLAEIVKSSLEVVRIVLNPRLPISPTVVYIDAEPEGPIGQVMLGNAITLTPGTVTLDVFNGRICVHCLTRDGAQALKTGDANRRIAELTTK
jgi:multicomponent Na+:H+ antiporter subunit E